MNTNILIGWFRVKWGASKYLYELYKQRLESKDCIIIPLCLYNTCNLGFLIVTTSLLYAFVGQVSTDEGV